MLLQIENIRFFAKCIECLKQNGFDRVYVRTYCAQAFDLLSSCFFSVFFLQVLKTFYFFRILRRKFFQRDTTHTNSSSDQIAFGLHSKNECVFLYHFANKLCICFFFKLISSCRCLSSHFCFV